MPTDTLPAVDELDPEDVDDLVEGWLLSQRMPSTAVPYRSAIEAFLRWCNDRDLPPLAATRRDIDRYRQHLARPRGATRRPLAAATQHRHLSTIASFYRYVILEGEVGLEHNPVENVRRPQVSNVSQREGLLLDEARALLAASLEEGPRTAALVHLLLSTALRVSEACGATTKDLGWTDGGVRTVRVVRKGGKQATIRIQPQFWAVIDAYLQERPQGPTGPLLMTERGQMDRNTARDIVAKLARRVVPHKRISPHSLRHTAATIMLDAGVAMQEVQAVLGHSTPAMTQRYDLARENRGQVGSAALGDALTRKDDES